MQSLSGKTALVTGASSGIGREIARHLGRAGCNLVLSGRDEGRLASVAAQVGVPTALSVHDLADPAETTLPLQVATEAFGKLDILVLNAGLFNNAPFAETDIATSQAMIDVNLSSVIRFAHAALPILSQQSYSDILGIGSIAGVSDLRDEAVYSASKHGLNAFFRSLRRQVASMGVRVSSILPGTVATELWRLTDPDKIDAKVAAGQVLRAEDIARMAEFILKQPPHIAIREMVVLPHNQDI